MTAEKNRSEVETSDINHVSAFLCLIGKIPYNMI